MSNQVRYNLNSRRIEEELLPYCQEHHVTIIATCSLTLSRWFVRKREGVVREQVADH